MTDIDKQKSSRLRRAFDLLDPRPKEEPKASKQIDDLDAWLKGAIENIDAAYAKERENIGEAYEDLEFRAGDHWPAADRERRAHEHRPILTINDVPQFVRQITGDIRLMKPSIKAIPIDARASAPVAKLLSGMIRYIEGRSHAKTAYALAADSQVAAGVGHWAVTTEYAQETTFNQEIRITHIEDGVSVLWDADAILPTREDATWCLVPVDISRAKFERKYPGVPVGDLNAYDKRYTQFWCGADTVRVGAYWEKRPATRRLALYPNGAIHDLTHAPASAEEKCRREGAQIRTRQGFRVFRSLITLGHILEEPEEWPGRHIPIIRVAGEEVRIGRRHVRHGVVRFMKDPCRLYNYARSQQAELYGLAPKSPWIGTDKNFEEYADEWEVANERNWPFLRYTPDPRNGNQRPDRVAPPATSPGLTEAVMLSARDKQGVTGIYNTSLGSHSNEVSGVAIRARESQSDVGNVVYVDNFSLAVAHTGTVILDLIPHVYDTERMVQIQDEDGSVRNVTINRAIVSGTLPAEAEADIEVGADNDDDAADAAAAPCNAEASGPTGDAPIGGSADGARRTVDDSGDDAAAIDLDPQGTRQEHVSPARASSDVYDNDVTIGSYQIVFEPGPAYATKREEARDGMADLIKSAPQIVPLILDLYVKAQDWPLAGEIAERLQVMLPPPIKAQIALERARAAGLPVPAEVTPPGPLPPGVSPPGIPPNATPPAGGMPPGTIPPGATPGLMPPSVPSPGTMPVGLPPAPPLDPAKLAALHADIEKAQAAAATARLNVETKAIERDIKALELRLMTAKAQTQGGPSPDVVHGLVGEIAKLHGMIAEIVAMLPRPMNEPAPPARPITQPVS